MTEKQISNYIEKWNKITEDIIDTGLMIHSKNTIIKFSIETMKNTIIEMLDNLNEYQSPVNLMDKIGMGVK